MSGEEWILILTLMWGVGSDRSSDVEVSPISFSSEETCQQAGQRWHEQARQGTLGAQPDTAQFVCAKR